MDVMSLRRGLMMQMASGSGVQFITGTISPEETGTITVSFGKTINNYIVLIEMTNASITTLENAGITSNKTYTFIGMKDFKQIADAQPTSQSLAVRYNGSSANTAAVSTITMYDDRFTIPVADITSSSANVLWSGYTYNYTIIPIA